MMGEATAAPTPMLDLHGLTRTFGGLVAVKDVTFSVAPGSVHSIIGPNGAGKTTVFNCITSFVQPTSGLILLEGRRIDGLATYLVSGAGVARTYQNIRLFQGITAIENVLVGRHRHLSAPFWEAVIGTGRFRKEENAARGRALELLDFVGIVDHADSMARSLPYGHQRRLEIARALASEPKILLLDEPAAGMNPAEGRALVRLIDRIRSELGVTVLLIEHHMRVVMAISDRITVLDRGMILAEGTPRDIHSDERVIAAYLGTQSTKAHGPPVEAPPGGARPFAETDTGS